MKVKLEIVVPLFPNGLKFNYLNMNLENVISIFLLTLKQHIFILMNTCCFLTSCQIVQRRKLFLHYKIMQEP